MKQRVTTILIIIILFLFNGINQNLLAQVAEQDSLALVALYDSTDGENWTTSTGWLTGPVSNWYGISVEDGRVTEVLLSSNNLTGTIPPQIGDLTNLYNLFLGQNNLTGEIPEDIYDLTNLINLRLESNDLEGGISSNIGNLVELVNLFLASNNLTGPIPAEIEYLDKLLIMYLRFNELSGEIPIGLYNMTTLVTLNLSVNQLEGTIPPQIENLVNLSEYSVPSNNMHGTVPDELGNLVQLKYLWLVGNEFEGALPNGIGNMHGLLQLRIENNQFTDMPDISNDTLLYNTQIQNNRFTFEDIEPNVGVGGFIYTPQDSIGEKQVISISQDSSLVMSVSVGGSANRYQWKKDGVVIDEATDSSYIIPEVTAADEGSYICEITNTIATELTLYSRSITVAVFDPSEIEDQKTRNPKIFSLHQNYPNPFNPKTTINYELEMATVIDLSIYNLQGKKMATLISKNQSAGNHQVEWDASDFPSGVYFYRLMTSSGYIQSRKMVVLK